MNAIELQLNEDLNIDHLYCVDQYILLASTLACDEKYFGFVSTGDPCGLVQKCRANGGRCITSSTQEKPCSYSRNVVYQSLTRLMCTFSTQTESYTTVTISYFFPRMIAWDTSPGLHPSRIRKRQRVLIDETNNIVDERS
jgi:hypothetical protein